MGPLLCSGFQEGSQWAHDVSSRRPPALLRALKEQASLQPGRTESVWPLAAQQPHTEGS